MHPFIYLPLCAFNAIIDPLINGTIHIINGANEPLNLVSSKYINMPQWELTSVPAAPAAGGFTRRSFSVEFPSRHEPRYQQKAKFAIGKKRMKLVLKARYCKADSKSIFADGPCFYLKWKGLDDDQYAVHPLGLTAFQPDSSYDIIIVPKSSGRQEVARPHYYSQWMEYYKDVINPLSIVQLTLPCSHDSGTYRPRDPQTALQKRTQYLSLIDQLRVGVRVLDFRLGYLDDTWIITHGKYPMSYTLEGAIQEVKKFIDDTTMELVMIDFHNLNALNGTKPDRQILKEYTRELLGEYALEYNEAGGIGLNTPLNELWSTANGKNRILLSWNTDPAQFGPSADWMWPAVNQKWFHDAKSIRQLYQQLTVWWETTPDGQAVSADGGDTAPTGTLYSSCIFTNNDGSEIAQARELSKLINRWLHGSDPWSIKANVLALDFIPDATNIVNAAIVANLIKGTQAAADVPIGPIE